MNYTRCGKSGLLLPRISFGLWNNFGSGADYAACRDVILAAFEHGISHFDLADVYGPPPGAAESVFGRILRDDLAARRDELVVATKAGHPVWDGPYGDWGSRKHLLAALDRSLKRLNVDYVDIFYHHRPDPDTPLEESLGALISAVRQGKALYIALSKYPPQLLREACRILAEEKVPCLAHQVRYNLLERPEDTLQAAADCGVGTVVFSPLAQGLLTNKYASGIPAGSRMSESPVFFRPEILTPAKTEQLRTLNAEAAARGMSLTEYAIRFVLSDPRVATAVVGARTKEQLLENIRYAE